MTISAFQRRQSAERGYSLAEILVVMAVFTVIIIAALLIYDRSNKVFKQSVESSDMQQSTRVAFDKLVADIRLAGFDYDRDGIPFGSLAATWSPKTPYVSGNLVQPNPPNGHVYICTTGGLSGDVPPTWKTGKNDVVNDNAAVWQENGDVQYQQPDEQIEYAGDKAITIRANFNYETATGPCLAAPACKSCENGREQCLEPNDSTFPVVTTNNQEIVTYALVSASGNVNANKDNIVFYVDTDSPRDVNPKTGKKETKVTIAGVDLTDKYPPYTLYRYALKDDGTPDGGVPIADNIRSMKFRYYTDTGASDIADATGKTHEIGCGDAAKCEAAALPFGEGQYDGSNSDAVVAERDTRAKIKSIRMTLIGMNPQVDNAYTDAGDSYAPHYRKLQLDTVIVPRNLGKHGMKEFNTTLPEGPTIKSVCVGACEAVYVTWAAPASGGDVDSYNIVYNVGDCTANPLTYAIAEDAGKNLAGYASKAVPGTQYRFAVQSINKYGSATSNCITATPINKTTPSTVASLSATGGADPTLTAQANKVQLYWPPVSTNIAAKSTMTCSDSSTQSAATIPSGEKIYYRVYRGTTAGFNPPGSGTKIIDENSPNQPTVSGANMTVTDPTAANCLSYYYKIEAVNYCVTAAAKNNPANTALAESGYIPAGNGILGTGSTTQIPAVPSGLAERSRSCGLLCDVTFGWLAVSTSAAPVTPMNIGRYKVYVTDNTTGNPIAGSPFTTTTLSYQVQNLDPGNALGYNIQVSALDCNEGSKSTAIIWPCTWDGGTITVVPNNQYGGTGATSGSPWIMQTPDTIAVTTQNVIKQIDWTMTNTVTSAIIAEGTDVGPKKNFTISVPDLPEDVPVRIRVAYTSASGTCALTKSYFVQDNSPQSCSLRDQQTDVTVVATAGKTLVLSLKNTSPTVLKPKRIIVKWNPNYAQNSDFDTITYPKNGGGTSTITMGCTTSTSVADVSADIADLPGGTTLVPGTLTPITLKFLHNTSISGSNNTLLNGSICIVYSTPTGDVLGCQIFPNANSCADNTGAKCQ